MATTLLTDVEIRILGSLMEKALSTPDYYPLSLNALTNACNQKSSRDPVVVYDEGDVQSVLEALEEKKLVNRSGVGRVPKYEELLSPTYDLVPRETAVLCVLMLRGPQTVGELRSRTGRLATFENLEAVTEILEKLVDWGLAQQLDRLPGRKESRYDHLLGERRRRCCRLTRRRHPRPMRLTASRESNNSNRKSSNCEAISKASGKH